MTRPSLRSDERGLASTMVAFLVAGVLFIGSIAAVLLTTRQGATGVAAATVPQADLHVQSGSLGQILLGSAGSTVSGTDWAGDANAAGGTTSADQVTRLGLRDGNSNDALLLSYGKFQNLRRAPYAAAVDGYVNYPEARAGFGLDKAGLDFHVRAYPTLPDVAKLLKDGLKDPDLRVTYLGDIDVTKAQGRAPPSDPALDLAVTAPACSVSPLSASPNPQDYRLAVTATNGGGSTTQFSALFTYTLNGTAQESQNANGPLVAPGQSVTLYVDVPASPQVSGSGSSQVTRLRSCAVGSTITVDVIDTNRAHVQVTGALSAATTNAKQAPRDLWLDTGKPYYVNANNATSNCSDAVKLYYDGNGLAKNEYVRATIRDAGGVVKYNASLQVPQSVQQRAATVGCLKTGLYTATLYYCGSTACNGDASRERVVEQVVVLAAAPDPYLPPAAPVPDGAALYTPRDDSRKEADYLNTLVAYFCPTYFDRKTESPLNTSWGTWDTRCSGFKAGQAQPGDVFPDGKDIMNNELPKRLVTDPNNCDANPRYDLTNVIVAGSNLDQTAMTSAAAKHCMATWVNGGGLLLVFGSTAQNVNWLEPIFHAAIRSSSGGLSTPDPGHPILNTADVLDYPDYQNYDRVWQFNGQTALQASALFNNVVVQGSDPVMTISNAGAIGDGTVILTTWQPYSLFNDTKDQDAKGIEGMKLVNNMLMQGYRDLFLDYGPPLPAHANIEPSVSRVHIQHPRFSEPILLDVAVYVFPS